MSSGPGLDKAADLLALHTGPGFVLPNAWDAGSARILEQVGFPAIATTSAGIAWACGVADGGAVDRDTMLAHIARIVDAVGVPVTADLEAGYGALSTRWAAPLPGPWSSGRWAATSRMPSAGRLFGIDEAVDRIAAARAAAPRGTFVLNARTDTYFAGTSGDVFAATVERAPRYVEAGADCVFVPGVVEEDTIRRLAAAIPGPLNVVAGLANTIGAPTLFSLGVKRVSLGGSLARAAMSAAGARRPGAPRLRNPRLPRRCDLVRRPAATLRSLTAPVDEPTGRSWPARSARRGWPRLVCLRALRRRTPGRRPLSHQRHPG